MTSMWIQVVVVCRRVRLSV